MKTQKEILSHSFNSLRIIINSYREPGEDNQTLVERSIETPIIIRELMNAVNPCMGKSHLINILRNNEFIESL